MRDPDAALMEFLQSTYAAAADFGKWDRKALECGLGEKGKVRVVQPSLPSLPDLT